MSIDKPLDNMTPTEYIDYMNRLSSVQSMARDLYIQALGELSKEECRDIALEYYKE